MMEPHPGAVFGHTDSRTERHTVIFVRPSAIILLYMGR